MVENDQHSLFLLLFPQGEMPCEIYMLHKIHLQHPRRVHPRRVVLVGMATKGGALRDGRSEWRELVTTETEPQPPPLVSRYNDNFVKNRERSGGMQRISPVIL